MVKTFYFKADYYDFYVLWKQPPLRGVPEGVFHFAFFFLLNTFLDIEAAERAVSIQRM